ncbi:MAG: DUF4116 domain-containing protein [Chlamydiae bacterium]|nr:DUF4116 domain-containing protein [Chlamydiota bacterium]
MTNTIQQINWGETPVAAAAAKDPTLAKTHAVFIGQPPRIENQDACTLPLANCAILGVEVPEAIEAADEYAMSFGEVSEDGMKLKDVPEACMDRIMVLAAVAQNGLALQFASEKLRADPDVVNIAVNQDPQAHQYADLPTMRADRREKWVRLVTADGMKLNRAPDPLKQDRIVVLAAMNQNGLAFNHIPHDVKSGLRREALLAAVAQNGLALEFGSAKLRADPDIVAAALAQNPQAINHVNCTFLYHSDGIEVIKGVLSPKGINAEQQIKKAIKDNGANFGVNDRHRDRDYTYNGKSMLPSFLKW